MSGTAVLVMVIGGMTVAASGRAAGAGTASLAPHPLGPGCVDAQGTPRDPDGPAEDAFATPGPLAPRPVTVLAPGYVGKESQTPVPPSVDSVRVGGGTVLTMTAGDLAARPSMVIAVNDDGSTRWTRCFDTAVQVSGANPSAHHLFYAEFGADQIARIGTLDVDTGKNADDFTDRVTFEPDVGVRQEGNVVYVGRFDGSGKTFGYDLAEGRWLGAVKAPPIDAGTPEPVVVQGTDAHLVGTGKSGAGSWIRDDLSGSPGEYQPLLLIGDTVVAAICADGSSPCEQRRVVGLDAATGADRWKLDGQHLLAYQHADNFFLASNSDGTWQMYNPTDGKELGPVLYSEGFIDGCCGDETLGTARHGGVIVAHQGYAVQIWLPQAAVNGDGPSAWSFAGFDAVPPTVDATMRGAACPDGTGPKVPDGWWFGFVRTLAEDALDFDIACATIQADGSTKLVNRNPRTRQVAIAGTFTIDYDTERCEGVPESERTVPNGKPAWLYVSGGHAVHLRQACNDG